MRVHDLFVKLRHLLGNPVLYRQPLQEGAVTVKKIGRLTILSFGGKLVQSIADPSPVLGRYVWNYFLLAPYFFSRDLMPYDPELCILGFGGGTAATLYAKFWPNIRITGIEKEQAVIDAAEQYFSLPTNVTLHRTDARSYLMTTNYRYDILLIDLFDNAGTIAEVTTIPFMRETIKHVKSNGVIVINFHGQEAEKHALIAFYQQQGLFVCLLPLDTHGVHSDVYFITRPGITLDRVRKRFGEEKRTALQDIVESAEKALQLV